MNPRMLRHVLRSVPTSVSVVTAMDGPVPVGHTVGTLVSVSLEPSLVGYLAMSSSGTLAVVRRSGRFSVNVLADDQADLGRGFAQHSGDRPDRFAGVRWRPGPNGSPHLLGAGAFIDCELDDVLSLGDHELVVGRVTGAMASRPDARPLVFSGGRFGTVAGSGRSGGADPAWERAG